VTDRLLIRGGTIVSLDATLGTLRGGDLLIEDGTIVAVAPRLQADAETIEAAGAIVMPGLIDAHRHLWYEIVRGMAMDSSLPALHSTIWATLAVHFTPKDVYLATRAAIVEALDNGITTVLDWCHVINTPEHGAAAVRAHRELPIRTVFAYGTSMRRKLGELEDAPADAAAVAELDRGALERIAGRAGKRMTFALALQGPESASMGTTRTEIAIARELGLPMSMHAGIQDGGPPRRAVARLAGAGLLAGDMQFVHCCTSGAGELRQIADAGARIVVCPMAEMALGIGLPPTARARDCGLRPAFGADAVCSASGDLFDEARLALLSERSLRTAGAAGRPRSAGDGPVPSTREALDGITIDAARACWLEDRVGSLGIGKRADIVLLRELGVDLGPAADLHAAIVGSARGSNVDTVIVDGEIVKRGGTLVGIDRERIGTALAAARKRLLAKAAAPPVAG
jgi:cytosine/adenosine deaminase-related metal-dependent hydrolase